MNMINTGDKLLCTAGNEFYEAGKLYTIGEFINDKYFELPVDEGCWYGTIDDRGIYVQFNCTVSGYGNAWFEIIENKTNCYLNFANRYHKPISHNV